MAGFLFNIGAERLILGTTIWGTSTFQARLVLTSAGAPSVDADSMTGIGTAQAADDVAITGDVAAARDDATNRVNFVADNIAFTSVAAYGACNRVVIYHYDTNDAGSFPIACIEITEVTPNTGDITVTMPTGGWFYTLQQTP